MYIIQVGFNHRTTPIEIREQFAFDEARLHEANVMLEDYESILENVILSTCNRTELYAVVDQMDRGIKSIKHFLQDWFSIPIDEFASYIVVKKNKEAVEHLFKVTTGLHSMVLGETQILGQVRDAFLLAQEEGTTGTIFNELFKRVVTFSKQSHRKTAIGANAVSISYAAVQLAKKIHGNLANKRIVIYGAGEMGELAMRHLAASGVENMTVVNRTLSRAESLAREFNAKALGTDNLQTALIDADILISSTAASQPVLTKDDLAPIQRKRRGKPLFLLDIAVPRDIDANISSLDSTFLYDIDDLQHIVDENKAKRERAAKQIEKDLQVAMNEFQQWIITLGVVPVIRALREKSFDIQQATYDSILRKIPDLDEREQKVILKHTQSIVNQILRHPITQAKEMSTSKDKESLLTHFVDIFGLDESIKHDIYKRSKQVNNILSKPSPTTKAIYDQ